MIRPTPSVSELLGGDHRELDDLFERFHDSPPSDRARRAALLAHFAEGLRRHIRIEESDLFPAMAEGDPSLHGLVERLLEDHRRIEDALGRLEARVGTEPAPTNELELDLMNVLWEHNAREEGVVYPWLDEHLAPERRRAVQERMEREPPARYDPPPE